MLYKILKLICLNNVLQIIHFPFLSFLTFKGSIKSLNSNVSGDATFIFSWYGIGGNYTIQISDNRERRWEKKQVDKYLYNKEWDQWQIQDLKSGMPTNYFAKFLPKTVWKWKI